MTILVCDLCQCYYFFFQYLEERYGIDSYFASNLCENNDILACVSSSASKFCDQLYEEFPETDLSIQIKYVTCDFQGVTPVN